MTKHRKQNTIVFAVLATVFVLTLLTIFIDQSIQYRQIQQSYLMPTSTPTPALKSFKNQSFYLKYPSVLTVTELPKGLRLSHSVDYNHTDFCDLKDGSIIGQVTDFDLTITVNDPPKNLSDFQPITLAGLTGQFMQQSVEGCGQVVYYFPDQKLTLVNKLVGEFSHVNPARQEFLNLSGIITPDQNQQFIDTIISSYAQN